MDRERIKNFTLDVLGCGCDQSVFNSIETEESVNLACGVILSRKIIIGRRLMIYIVPAENCAAGRVADVIRDGLDEREKCGYNRLRLVIVSPDTDGISAAYNDAFVKTVLRDEKCHIHVVSPEDAV